MDFLIWELVTGKGDGGDHITRPATAKLLIGGPMRLEGVASGYWTRSVTPSSGSYQPLQFESAALRSATRYLRNY